MPCDAAVIRQYLRGKKYLKLQNDAGYNYSKYKQFLPASNKRKHEYVMLHSQHVAMYGKMLELMCTHFVKN